MNMYIYIYTYIYTISGLFFGSTVVALGVRMYWKSEVKILICLGAVNPQRWRWNHIPEFNGPYDAGWDIQHPNIALYIARVLYPWAYQPIPNLNQTLHKKKTLLLIFTSFFFQLCIWGNFSGGLKLKTRRVLLEFTISGIYKYISHFPLGNLQPLATSHNEDRGSIHQNSRRVIVDINGQPNCIQENHTLGGSSWSKTARLWRILVAIHNKKTSLFVSLLIIAPVQSISGQHGMCTPGCCAWSHSMTFQWSIIFRLEVYCSGQIVKWNSNPFPTGFLEWWTTNTSHQWTIGLLSSSI